MLTGRVLAADSALVEVISSDSRVPKGTGSTRNHTVVRCACGPMREVPSVLSTSSLVSHLFLVGLSGPVAAQCLMEDCAALSSCRGHVSAVLASFCVARVFDFATNLSVGWGTTPALVR